MLPPPADIGESFLFVPLELAEIPVVIGVGVVGVAGVVATTESTTTTVAAVAAEIPVAPVVVPITVADPLLDDFFLGGVTSVAVVILPEALAVAAVMVGWLSADDGCSCF